MKLGVDYFIRDAEVNCNTCNGCPCVFTDESEKIQNYGCLPDHNDLVKKYLNNEGIWACHSNPKKPCGGLIQILKSNSIPMDKNNKLILSIGENCSEEQYKALVKE